MLSRVEKINDFVVRLANVNGSGSASANRIFARSIIRMGVPVGSRNIFPSNIQGLPTWYEVRVSGAGHLGRRGGYDMMVAMNPQTWDKDVAGIDAGGYLFYDSTKPMPSSKFREDITVIGMPLTEICNKQYSDPRQRQLFKNIMYVGALDALLGIETEVTEELIKELYKGKDKLIAPNMEALHIGRDYAEKNLKGAVGLKVKRANSVGDRILIEGNAAAALGCVYGGATVAAWYPITPSTSVAEAFASYCKKFRAGEDGNNYAIVQAEDELAAIGMVLGAGWAGARSLTATSGPGISLMAEFVGLGYFAEIPAVIWDIQRMGPSTGLPTRTSQGDITAAYYLSHGDTRHPVLFPATPKEAFEMAGNAFDLAERLQTPVFVLSDLDLGMNIWISDEFDYPEKPMDRGKVLSAEQLKELGGKWGRYLDVDGDGIPYRTLPGTRHPSAAYFTRGTGHTPYATYSERPDDWENNLKRLHRKFETARTLVPAPVIDEVDGAHVGIISLGSNDPAVHEARSRLRGLGIETSYLRVRALPFTASVRAFVEKYDKVYVIENNFDGQLLSILQTEMPDLATRLIKTAKCDGLPLSARWITEQVSA